MRKNILLKVIILSVFSVLLFSACSKSSSSKWDLVLEGEIKHGAAMLGFINKDSGIAIGEFGKIYFTNDGGQTWEKATNKSFDLFGIEIVDENIAFNSGSRGHVGVTEDGGKTWTRLTDYGESFEFQYHCRYLSFLSRDTGWIASTEKLASTFNGGQSWNEIALPEGIKRIKAIDMWSKTEGCILDNDYTLFFTNDSGKTWQKQNIEIENPNKKISMSQDTAMRFSNKDNGKIIAQISTPEGSEVIELITNDGGKTWMQEKLPVTPVDISNIYLTRNGKTLTAFNFADGILVFERKDNQ
ncbi:MAG: hypothetical protein JW822_12085 [Spirochaetales bacterium]|nr:hypothetical protein [Spirochaetales bacterium]